MRIFLVFLCFFTVQLNAQDSLSIAPRFPEDWAGVWKGDLNIWNAKGLSTTIPMTIDILPIDTSTTGRYTFGLTYGSKNEDWRPYELVPVKPELGLWRVDEKNTIVMESFLLGPKFLCWFVVAGERSTRILCTYERLDAETMAFEVIAGTEAPASTTGKSKHEGEDIPEVKTYPVNGFQRALLKRQK